MVESAKGKKMHLVFCKSIIEKRALAEVRDTRTFRIFFLVVGTVPVVRRRTGGPVDLSVGKPLHRFRSRGQWPRRPIACKYYRLLTYSRRRNSCFLFVLLHVAHKSRLWPSLLQTNAHHHQSPPSTSCRPASGAHPHLLNSFLRSAFLLFSKLFSLFLPSAPSLKTTLAAAIHPSHVFPAISTVGRIHSLFFFVPLETCDPSSFCFLPQDSPTQAIP